MFTPSQELKVQLMTLELERQNTVLHNQFTFDTVIKNRWLSEVKGKFNCVVLSSEGGLEGNCTVRVKV